MIDYYSAPTTAHGDPVFSLDVRPALDSVGSIRARVSAGMDEVRAMARERGWPV